MGYGLERRDRVPGHKGYVKAEGTQCFLCLSFLLVRFAFRNPRPKTKGTTWSKEDFSSAEVKENFN